MTRRESTMRANSRPRAAHERSAASGSTVRLRSRPAAVDSLGGRIEGGDPSQSPHPSRLLARVADAGRDAGALRVALVVLVPHVPGPGRPRREVEEYARRRRPEALRAQSARRVVARLIVDDLVVVPAEPDRD